MARRKRGQGYRVFPEPETIKFVYEGTTVLAFVRDYGAHTVYDIAQDDKVIWSQLVYREEDHRRKQVSYEHDVIADYLAAVQEPKKHGALCQTALARPIVMKFQQEQRQNLKLEEKHGEPEQPAPGL